MRRSRDFEAAVRGGRRAGSRTVVLHAALHGAAGVDGAGGRTPPARVGFVVSKAVGTAVVRNRVKRRLRHVVRDRVGQWPAGTLVVVRANPAAAAADHDRLVRDLDRCWARLDLADAS